MGFALHLQQLAVPLAHIAASIHEGLLGAPAQRPGTQDGWLNIIAMGCRQTDPESVSIHPCLFTAVQKSAFLSQIPGSSGTGLLDQPLLDLGLLLSRVTTTPVSSCR